MDKKIIWLRRESRLTERRTPLLPQGALRLINEGHSVVIEKSRKRIIADSAYADVGCRMVDGCSWPDAPKGAIILGLKELPEEPDHLHHNHIYFAHAFKAQNGWQKLLSRFKAGGGSLLDIEYMTGQDGRRVAAFGFWAGYMGAALALIHWQNQQSGQQSGAPRFLDSGLQPFDTANLLNDAIKQADISGKKPKVLIIGAGGRAGKGALEIIKKYRFQVTCWGRDQTDNIDRAALLDHDILINCACITGNIPAFLRREDLTEAARLSLVVDVACDPFSSFNPIALYENPTTWEKPYLTVEGVSAAKTIDIIAIDNLPSLLPREASYEFARLLLPHLLTLDRRDHDPIWSAARTRFEVALAQMSEDESPNIHWIGAGLASGPGIVALANQWGVTVWDMTRTRAEALKAHVTSEAILNIRPLDLDNEAARTTFTAALKPGDVMISMLPAGRHIQVAKLALTNHCHLITSSYLSDDMIALNEEAVTNGLCLVNEVGLDPGIDHLLSHILVHAAQEAGMLGQGHMIDFISYCGGIPATKTAFTYKFSWTPLGVLTALTNPAKMIKDSREHAVAKAWDEVTELSIAGEKFEVYANRDSLPYIKEYGLAKEKNLRTFVRGTLRQQGWKAAWRDIFAALEQSDPKYNQESRPKTLKILSDKLWQDHRYGPGERDRVLLYVALTATPEDGPPWHGALSLDITGSGWQSAMAATVSLTVAEAAAALMEGRLPPGVQTAPHDISEARRWLKGLKENGLAIKAENVALEI